MPILGADMTAGTLVAWRRQPGDTVKRGDIIAEVETDKGLIDVEVFVSGVLEKVLVPPGATVPTGTVLAFIREEGEAPGVAPPAAVPAAPAVAPARLRISPAAKRLAEVLDLRSLRPLDTGAILASVAKTHRALVVDEGWRTCSFAAEVSARIMEGGFYDLDIPVARVCSAEVPIPYAKHLEDAALPQAEAIVTTVREMLRRG